MLGSQKIDIRTGTDFEPVPMDRYTVQIADVNIVKQFNSYQGKEEDVLNYQFVILDDKPMPEKDDGSKPGTTRGRFLWRRCRPALNDRSWLGKLAKAAYGRSLTKEEIEGFDPEYLIGRQVDVMVEQAESKKDASMVFNNIVSFAKNVKSLPSVEVKPKTASVVEKQSVPAIAPKSDEDVDSFVGGLDKERAATNTEDVEEAEAEAEALNLAAKAAAAKARAAKLKAGRK
mgnify:CR=1 FL=1